MYSILAKYPMYVGTRNYADVRSMTEYMHHDATLTTPKQLEYVSAYPYAEIVGSLLYFAVVSRPDISYAVGVLTRHLKCPTYASCKAASRVLTYLSQHPAVCIRYSDSTLDLHVYCNNNRWGGDKDTRQPTSGVLIMMAGGPVKWMSKLQPIATVSSMEAKYLACFFAIQDIVWIRQLLKDINRQ